MRLSHDPSRLTLLNLRFHPGQKGPYLIRQDGYAPGSTDLTVHRFFLLRDGLWIRNHRFYLLDAAEQRRHLLHDVAEAIDLIDSIAGQPVRADASLPPETTPEEIIARMQSIKDHLIHHLQNATGSPFGSP
ncbi:MAG: hypothetical protein MUF31_06915 [Akkermansiaceae bacterium]|jgi:hypothetical protein|nr:hypothetical protein [Akkermansiaceae bacterium]